MTPGLGPDNLPPVPAAAAHGLPEFLTKREAAELLRVTRPTVDHYVRDGKLGNYGVPGKRLVKTSEVLELLNQGPTRPSPHRVDED